MTENEHPDNNKKNTKNDENKLINSLLNKETHEPDKTSNNSNKPTTNEKPISLNGRRIIWSVQDKIQVVLAILTFGTLLSYIIFSRIQASQTKEAINRSDTANFYTRKAIDISNRTLKHTIISDSINDIAAKQDLLTRERNTEMDLRAYCVVLPTTYFFNISDSTKPGIAFKIKNVGKTPAYNVYICAGIILSEKVTSHEILEIPSEKMLIIGAGEETAEQKYIASFSFNKQYFENIKIGKQSLFVVMKVTYQDIFKKDRFLYFGSYYDFTTETPAAIPGFIDGN